MVVYISQGADHEELLKISGDESRTFNVDDFTMLDTVKDAISKETCKASGIDKLCFSFQFFFVTGILILSIKKYYEMVQTKGFLRIHDPFA